MKHDNECKTVLPCPFCGTEAVEFDVLAPEAYYKEAWRIKHVAGCWFGGETIINPHGNCVRWNERR